MESKLKCRPTIIQLPPLTMNIKSEAQPLFQLSHLYYDSCGRGSLLLRTCTPGPVVLKHWSGPDSSNCDFSTPSLCQLTCLSSIHLSPRPVCSREEWKGKMPVSGLTQVQSIPRNKGLLLCTRLSQTPLREKLQCHRHSLITHQPCGPPLRAGLSLRLGN